ncbi:hypothetical protein B0J13DRAFT_175629 [Dactylonectria estremocensis]|uniref:Uncharacterized protein n=1 Tax=Dactylonectria estremocensis TaxID=1079267 RepID=A0A9P9FCW2_9HYPO|nr:hypothetical protein B0J13DRAFT_175629 [Dactylonectria estremocensis]
MKPRLIAAHSHRCQRPAIRLTPKPRPLISQQSHPMPAPTWKLRWEKKNLKSDNNNTMTMIKSRQNNKTENSPGFSCSVSAWTSRRQSTSSCWHWRRSRSERNCLRQTRNPGSGGRRRRRQQRRQRHPERRRRRRRARHHLRGSGRRAPATGNAGRSPGSQSAPWCQQMDHRRRARVRMRVRDGRHHMAAQGQSQPLAVAAERARSQRGQRAGTERPRDLRRLGSQSYPASPPFPPSPLCLPL